MNIKKRLDILIKNAAIYTMDSENAILHGGMIVGVKVRKDRS
jgi:hypothetical protein